MLGTAVEDAGAKCRRVVGGEEGADRFFEKTDLSQTREANHGLELPPSEWEKLPWPVRALSTLTDPRFSVRDQSYRSHLQTTPQSSARLTRDQNSHCSHACQPTPTPSIMAHWVPEVEYLSTGANRHGAVADWSGDGVLAFGADTNVALWTPEVSEDDDPCRLRQGAC